MARRGRKAKGGMSIAQMRARENEAAALLGLTPAKRRRLTKKLRRTPRIVSGLREFANSRFDSQFSGDGAGFSRLSDRNPVVVVTATTTKRRGRKPKPMYDYPIGPQLPGRFQSFKTRASNYFRKGNKMPRGRKKNAAGLGQQSYAQVTSSLPVQVSIQAAEALFALGSVGIDVYTNSTASKADDFAFPIIEYGMASVGRYAAQKYLSRKHPGLAAAVSHGFSSANGDRIGTLIRQKLDSFLGPKNSSQGGK